jgi:hypothetical protein
LNGEDNIINDDNYSEKLEDYFNNNKSFRECIIKKITDFIIEQKEIDNIIEKIYESKNINQNSIDLISVIIEYIKDNIFSKYIKIILCLLEDNNILTTLLFLQNHKNIISNEFSNLVPKMIETYLNNIKIEKIEINIKPKFTLNHLVPGFYNFYTILTDFINDNILNDFIKNEKKIRFYLNTNKFDTKQNYYKKEEDFLSLTYHEIENHEFASEFITKIPPNILLNDYITYFFAEYDIDKGFEINYNIIIIIFQVMNASMN